MLALRSELELRHDEGLREALALERAQANEARVKAVAEGERRAREEQRQREIELASQQARARAAATAQEQQRANHMALSSYAAELTSLRESLGAKKTALLPNDHGHGHGQNGAARAHGVDAPGTLVHHTTLHSSVG